ncbi:MAG: protoporphyrinogen oxidase [Magnetococcales bacterium]|nr:protoporphyrinogen oxidase [Magnetococcales bacterium]
MDTLLILGAGVSGLSTAWFLHRRGVAVRVLEARSRPGGNLHTMREEGRLYEYGPNSTLQKPGSPEDGLGRLAEGLGLGSRCWEANPAAQRRYIVRGGRLIALPGSPPGFLATRAFSWRAKLRLMLEPLIGRADHEESIAEFVRRRLGQEFLDYAIEPFISGVYAGDPAVLSIRAAVPKIYNLERDHGSLIRGAFALHKVTQAGMPRGRLVGFDEGMGVLPRAIVEALPPGSVELGAAAHRLERLESGRWRAYWREGGAGEERFAEGEGLVLALPAPEAARLLEPFSAQAAEQLRGIAYAPIAAVMLGWRKEAVAHPLDGFGFLVPRKEGVRTLGGLFSSTLFPGRAPEGEGLLTCFIGGAMDAAALELSDEALIQQTQRDAGALIGAAEGAGFTRVTRHAAAIPQYRLGHLERLEAIDRALTPFPGLWTRANWREGISVADCIRQGEKTAERILQERVVPPFCTSIP